MLIATKTPIFSFLLICWRNKYFHGRNARAMSATAE